MPQSAKEVEELREVFKSFDLDGNGSISVKELGKCMEKLGEPMSEKECADLIKSTDIDSDGCMNFEEFAAMVSGEGKEEDIDDEKSMMEAFALFDKNGDGHIQKEELGEVLKALDENPTTEAIDEMFKEADVDGDGKITYEEFKSILRDDQ